MDTNIKNKKGIPLILIVLIFIIIAGSASMTFAVAKMTNLEYLMSKKASFAGLSSIFRSAENTAQEDENFAEQDIVVADNQLQDEQIIPTEDIIEPILTDEPESSILQPGTEPTQTPKPATPTPTPIPTQIPSPTPTPTPKPNICSIPLKYRLGTIDWQFDENDFDRDKLKEIVLYAESQWESAININLLEYDNQYKTVNTINFTPDAPIFFGSYEAGQLSEIRRSLIDKDGIVKEFEINIFAGIFSFTENQGLPLYSAEESTIARAVMHQMGHVLGLDHLPTGQPGVMSTKWTVSQSKPTLNDNDKNAIGNLCK